MSPHKVVSCVGGCLSEAPSVEFIPEAFALLAAGAQVSNESIAPDGRVKCPFLNGPSSGSVFELLEAEAHWRPPPLPRPFPPPLRPLPFGFSVKSSSASWSALDFFEEL